MAKSKIETQISFSAKGADNVTGEVNKINGSVNKTVSAVDTMQRKINAIGVGVAFQSTINAVNVLKSSFENLKNMAQIPEFVKSEAAVADTIAKTSRTIGLQVAELEKWRYVAQRGGMDVASIDNAIKKFSVSVGKAAAGETMYLDAFNALGIALRTNDGRIKSNNDLLLEMADAYNKLTDAQDKNRVSSVLFGRGTIGVSTIMEGGAKAVEELMRHRESLGGLFSEKDAKNAEDFDDKLLDIDIALNSIKRKAATITFPIFNKLMDKFTAFWMKHKESVYNGIQKVYDVANKIYGITGPILPIVAAIGTVVGSVVVPSVLAVGAAIGAAWPLITSIGGAVATIGAHIAAFGTVMKAVILPTIAPIVGYVGLVAAGIVSWGITINSIIKNWDMLWGAIKDASKDLGEFVGGIAESVVAGFRSAVDWIVNKVADIMNMMSSLPLVGDKFASASNFVRGFSQQEPPSASKYRNAVAETRTTTTNKLSVDFNGLPANAVVTPSQNFDYDVIDYSAGYAFGGG